VGTSNWQNISYNIELVRKLNPKSILDIGVGFGRWGILFREFLEIWEKGKYDGNWDRTIDGIEIYEPYIKDYHRYFYTNIYKENALDFLRKNLKHYDLINCGDVIEHFTKDEGKELIRLALEKGTYVLITIPIGRHWKQETCGDNPYEQHKSIWYNNDFTKYKYHKIKSFSDLTLRNFSVVLLSRRRIRYEKRFGRFFIFKNILKHKAGLKKIVEKYESRKRKS
jgi:predicted SAM-dependent methyltransferase